MVIHRISWSIALTNAYEFRQAFGRGILADLDIMLLAEGNEEKREDLERVIRRFKRYLND
jgi:hypothetical protein